MDRWVIYFFVFILAMGLVSSINFKEIVVTGYQILPGFCDDGTREGKCSVEKPYFCDNNELVRDCDLCGCGNGYLCFDSGCVPALTCEEGNGICFDDCAGLIEFEPLTYTCNIDANEKGYIDTYGGDSVFIEVNLFNNNELDTLRDLNINAVLLLGGEEIVVEGFSLSSLRPKQDFSRIIELKMPENLDEDRYVLNVQVHFGDEKIFGYEYSLNVIGKGLVYVVPDVKFDGKKEFEIGAGLNVDVNIINKKCCMAKFENVKNRESFKGYCEKEIAFGECGINKPDYCDSGILVDNCLECGCSVGYNCEANGKCVNAFPDEQRESFYDLLDIRKQEQDILKFGADKFGFISRDVRRASVFKSPKVPVKPEVGVEYNKIEVSIADVKMDLTKTKEEGPTIDIDIQGDL